MAATLAALLVLPGCSEPVASDGGERPVVGVELQPSLALNMVAGDSVRLTAYAIRDDSSRTRLPASEVVWRSSSPVAVSIDTAGTLHALQPAESWVGAEVGDMESDSVLIRARQPTGTFGITLVFASDVHEGWRTALDSAARRWEATMGGELEPAVIDHSMSACGPIPNEPPPPEFDHVERGVLIYVGQSGSFSPGTLVEATGGPCLNRPLPAPTTIFGKITLNRDRPIDGISSGRLRYLAVHEMGHVLGLVGLVQGVQPPWFDQATGRYTGAMALEARRREFGVIVTDLLARSGAHWWSGSVGLPDVMVASGPSDAISTISVGALMDLGYPALWTGAGPY